MHLIAGVRMGNGPKSQRHVADGKAAEAVERLNASPFSAVASTLELEGRHIPPRATEGFRRCVNQPIEGDGGAVRCLRILVEINGPWRKAELCRDGGVVRQRLFHCCGVGSSHSYRRVIRHKRVWSLMQIDVGQSDSGCLDCHGLNSSKTLRLSRFMVYCASP